MTYDVVYMPFSPIFKLLTRGSYEARQSALKTTLYEYTKTRYLYSCSDFRFILITYYN